MKWLVLACALAGCAVDDFFAVEDFAFERDLAVAVDLGAPPDLREIDGPPPFGFVTSEGTAEMRETATAAGALFLVAKPFTPEAFAEVLSPVLG